MKPSKAYQFFLAHAGYSYNPKTETPMQGRKRCALILADAEFRASEAGCFFRWHQDDMTSREWTEEGVEYPTWECTGYTADGEPFASLGGCDFGESGEPWGNPYRRVVEAELACELPSHFLKD